MMSASTQTAAHANANHLNQLKHLWKVAMMSPPPTSIANRQDPSDLAISPKHQLTTQIFGNFARRPMA